MTTITTTSVLHARHPPKLGDEEISPVDRPSTDPYALQARLVPQEELRNLRQRGLRRDKVRKFYEEQNENIERLLKSVDEHRLAADIEHEDNSLKVGVGRRH
jgi:hypothetical protein